MGFQQILEVSIHRTYTGGCLYTQRISLIPEPVVCFLCVFLYVELVTTYGRHCTMTVEWGKIDSVP